MYAIVRAGGKQYKVVENGIVTVDKLVGEAGEAITLGDVLYVGGTDTPQWGKPTVEGASVTATILAQAKAKKINAFNYKPKQNIRKHWGHRQQVTRVRIDKIAVV